MEITVNDIELAQRGKKLLKRKGKLKLASGSSTTVELPESAKAALEKTLSYIAEGKAVMVVPEPAELTTQQLADLLHVSRPFAVKLLEDEKIPFRKVGKHRRVLTYDALKYKDRIDKKRLKVLEKLAADAQELGLGY